MHTPQRLTPPAKLCLVFLPPYRPALSLLEQIWRDLKDALEWLQFRNLDGPQDYIVTLPRGYQAAMRQALTGYTYLVGAVYSLAT